MVSLSRNPKQHCRYQLLANTVHARGPVFKGLMHWMLSRNIIIPEMRNRALPSALCGTPGTKPSGQHRAVTILCTLIKLLVPCYVKKTVSSLEIRTIKVTVVLVLVGTDYVLSNKSTLDNNRDFHFHQSIGPRMPCERVTAREPQ